MELILILIPFFLTYLICFFNGARDGVFLLLPIFSNDIIYSEYKKFKFFELFILFSEIFGALFLSKIVIRRIQFGFIEISQLTFNEIYIAFIVILFVATIIYLLSSFLPFPISLSHSIIGGLVGVGLCYGINIFWDNIFKTVLIWTITPILSLIIGYLVYITLSKICYRFSNPLISVKIFLSIFYLILSIFLIFIVFDLNKIGSYILILYIILMIIMIALNPNFTKKTIIKDKKNPILSNFKQTDSTFAYFGIVTLPFVFISHGANDVANSLALLLLLAQMYFNINKFLYIPYVPYILIILGAIILSIGIIVSAKKNAQKYSNNIFQIESIKIFSTYYSLSFAMILFSFFGYRISSIYTLTGSYIGVGYAKGFSIFNSKLLFELLISWLITFALSISLSYSLSHIINFVGIFL